MLSDVPLAVATGGTVGTMSAPSEPSGGTPLPPSPWDPTAIPAATVVVIRDRVTRSSASAGGIEVLMLRRDSSLAFAAGAWVFPGGRIDPADLHAAEDTDQAAKRAAVREAAEEAGLALDDTGLWRWSHWTPPAESPRRRFSTAFFVAQLADGFDEIRVDDGEIREFRWHTPDDALAQRDAGIFELTPPTFITLCQLRSHPDAASVVDTARRLERSRSFEHFATRISTTSPEPGEFVVLYHGDAGYAAADATIEGPRHRLRMGPTWRYERDE